VDLKSAFDSVVIHSGCSSTDLVSQKRQSAWYRHCSCVWVDGVCSDWFKVLGEVHHSCAIAPDLLLAPVF